MLSFPSCVDNQLSSIQKAIKSLLRRYEERFLGTNVPSLFCPHQDMRMSDFTFETGKMSDEEYQFFHNGPDFTEVILYFLYACGFFSCASVLHDPWHLTFTARLLENISFFHRNHKLEFTGFLALDSLSFFVEQSLEMG